MKVNYHTHSNFCNHACGNLEDYVKAAIDIGLTELGFSEHGPYIFEDGHESGFRIKISRVEEYVSTLKALREKYKDKIKIHIGFELEYYPKYFEKTLEFAKNSGIEYLIHGQHFINNEQGDSVSVKTNDQAFLECYVDTVCEAIETGVFTYINHPDMINFAPSDSEIYKKNMERLCLAAKKRDIPIEFNILGFRTGRHYPCKQFWEIAARVGNRVVIGIDAHDPAHISENGVIEQANEYLKSLSITPIEKIDLIRL